MSRIVEFFNSLSKAKDEATFIDICKAERDFLRELYPNRTSLMIKFTQYRNYLKHDYYKNKLLLKSLKDIHLLSKDFERESYVDELNKAILTSSKIYNLPLTILQREYNNYLTVLNYLRLKKSESKEITNNYKAIVKERRKKKLGILDVDGYLNKAVTLLNTNSLALQVLGLAALTGRRVAEIGCTADFKYIDDNNLLFQGQLKTKKEEVAAPYKIPVLADSKIIIAALKKLRLNYSKYINNPEKFHNNCSSPLSKNVHVFEEFIEESLTAKDLRAIYAAITYQKFCDKKMDYTVYYSMVLGHEEKDQYTCLSYAKYKIA